MYTEAEETYRLAMQVFPGSPEANYGLASLLTLRGEKETATELIEQFQARSVVEEPSADKFPAVRLPER